MLFSRPRHPISDFKRKALHGEFVDDDPIEGQGVMSIVTIGAYKNSKPISKILDQLWVMILIPVGVYLLVAFSTFVLDGPASQWLLRFFLGLVVVPYTAAKVLLWFGWLRWSLRKENR